MNLQIEPVALEEKPILAQLIELYLYDFSEYSKEDIGDNGCYGYGFLDYYWTESGRQAFFLRVNGELAGFVLVRRITPEGEQPEMHSIAEFFVMRKYRRMGIGREAALRTFDMFPGRWQVAQIDANIPAQVFWRKVIGEYTGGDYEEVNEPGWGGPVQHFSTK